MSCDAVLFGDKLFEWDLQYTALKTQHYWLSSVNIVYIKLNRKP